MTLTTGPKEPTNSTVERGDKLTPRERVVMNYLIRGLTNQEIAEKMKISERGIESHLVNIRFKTGQGRRVTLALWWFAQKLNKRLLEETVKGPPAPPAKLTNYSNKGGVTGAKLTSKESGRGSIPAPATDPIRKRFSSRAGF